MMSLEAINANREFLLRTQLQGREVHAFNQVVEALANEERITRIAIEAEQRRRAVEAAMAQQPPESPQAEPEAGVEVLTTEE